MIDQTSALLEFFAERLADRDLTPDESARLATELATHRELWQHQVRHSDEERIYTSLYRDHHLDVWLICWNQRQDTGLHDHDLSGGAVHVVEGALDEDRLRLGEGIDTIRYEAGEAFSFDPSRIHDVRHAGDSPTVSLHLYSPPLWRMGHYEAGADGRLSRRSASYAEELRPS
jgi:quercetin dioxygenase-like cupin family protein